MIRYAIVVAMCVSVAGCGGMMADAVGVKAGRNIPMDLNQEQIAAVHEGVRKALKDPDSARFGALKATDHSGDEKMRTIAVCGLVNGKNSYGGFTGDVIYQGLLTQFTGPNGTTYSFAADVGGTGKDYRMAAGIICSRYGIEINTL